MYPCILPSPPYTESLCPFFYLLIGFLVNRVSHSLDPCLLSSACVYYPCIPLCILHQCIPEILCPCFSTSHLHHTVSDPWLFAQLLIVLLLFNLNPWIPVLLNHWFPLHQGILYYNDTKALVNSSCMYLNLVTNRVYQGLIRKIALYIPPFTIHRRIISAIDKFWVWGQCLVKCRSIF